LFLSWRGRRDWQRERYRERRRYIVGGSLGGLGKWFGTHGRTIGAFGRLDILYVFKIASAANAEGTTRTAR
jgi:hypothetical protein